VKPSKGRILTQHTGLPPRDNGSGAGTAGRKPAGPVRGNIRKPR